jgi:hypothetical protein
MAKYVIYEDKETGKRTAHTENYTKKDGEKKVGTSEGANADEALSAYDSGDQQGAEGSDEEGSDGGDGTGYSLTEGRAKVSPEQQERITKREADQLRKEEESKQEFEVMQDANGNVYVSGGDSDPKNSKKSAKAESKAKPPEPPEPGSLGKFRAKSEQEAIAMAKGEYVHPAQGAQRGSQTP